MAQRFPRELLDETLVVAARCTFSLDEIAYQYPDEVVPSGEAPAGYLRRLTYEGAGRRWPDGVPAKVQHQIEHELELITELKYEHYFLTVADIVQFAQSQKILCQGRGSAANSVVCYCLGVTEVDPARMSVLFERFKRARRDRSVRGRSTDASPATPLMRQVVVQVEATSNAGDRGTQL